MTRPQLIEGKYTEEHLHATAKTIVEKKTANTIVLDEAAENLVPKFGEPELTLGRVLGRGGFCVVNEVTKITLMKKFENNQSNDDNNNTNNNNNNNNNKVVDDEHAIHNIVQDRMFMESHCLRGKGKDCRYAIKKLQDSCYNDASTYINGIVDLAIEARFLSVVRHANIIKMRAMSCGTPYDSNFFVVLDRLYDILTKRLMVWKKEKPPSGGMMKKLLDRTGKKETAFWVERITFAFDLACALKYLHESRIMYRDIKPDNIGFDVRGDIKIFDFGLAKEFDPSHRDRDGMFHYTGDTGSPRYMDPQVARNLPYNEKCDVYSFCVLLWEMLELSTPFEGFNLKMFQERVVNGNSRPRVNTKWPENIQTMIRSGFGDIHTRYSMVEVCETIRLELCKYSDDEVTEIKDISHKGDRSLREAQMARRSFTSARKLKMES